MGKKTSMKGRKKDKNDPKDNPTSSSSSSPSSTKSKKANRKKYPTGPSVGLLNMIITCGLTYTPTPMDGNCMFTSTLTSVRSIEPSHSAPSDSGSDFDDDTTSSDFRTKVAEHLWEHRDDYTPFFTPLTDVDNRAQSKHGNGDFEDLQDEDFRGYCGRMGSDGEWGGELELLAISRVLRREVWVFCSSDAGAGDTGDVDGYVRKVGERVEDSDFGFEDGMSLPVCVAFDGVGHYDSLTHRGGGGGGKGEEGGKEERRKKGISKKERRRKERRDERGEEEGGLEDRVGRIQII